ncbi:MAG: universal stress protein [Paracoccaceae bacterium]|jgi:nucleotide-binding universal stress UspA family protein|uniref:universal stress protein n=1 Tax=unclassified Seohaeicola TaxID=2641111 RepID=UPI00237BBF83|nr:MULTISPECIES: universal stress protein [unclassified Seohaeicola]MDD9705834.1 universal stress protein [Seohaeicola sp. 4SK31]MDD9735345.1 universal stress protein [Seohaeicola sp. SP36]MDF1708580.1 universal stress protein [Paracoccaceae bacterium]
MAYKTLFSVITDTALAGPVLDQAIAMATAWDAHLDVLCMGLDRTQTGFYYAGANALILQETITRAQDEARAVEAHVRKILEASDVRWGLDSGVAQLADMGRHVAQRARFSDLVILPKPYGEKRGVELEPILESAMFDGAAPVLMVPEAGQIVTAPQRILLAWNESDEALEAARTALPLLIQADSVRIVVIDPPVHSPTRSDPGGLLSQYLSRHGVNCEIDVLSKTLPRVSDVLMRHAADVEADMIVMGAYGHSRFREAILGGATRNMLEHAKIPVFLAH